MQKQSPPMPVMCGSTTLSTATAVTAASAALPPARRHAIAASLASGCDVAAIPSQAMTGERPGRWKLRFIVGVERFPVEILSAIGGKHGLFDGDVAARCPRRNGKAADH